jgi:chromosomal replication initiator protein
VLLVDGVDFLAGREQTQEEFFRLFERIRSDGCQLVLSANAAPSEIPDLADRLVSRFQSGLVASVEAPILETRVAILRSLANRRSVEVNDEVLELAADGAVQNVHDLRERLDRIAALARAQGCVIDAQLARRALTGEQAAFPPIAAIVGAVASRLEVEPAGLLGRGRKREIAYARDVAIYLSRRLTGLSLEEVAEVFAGRGITEILDSCRSISQQASTDTELSRMLDEIASEANNGAC